MWCVCGPNIPYRTAPQANQTPHSRVMKRTDVGAYTPVPTDQTHTHTLPYTSSASCASNGNEEGIELTTLLKPTPTSQSGSHSSDDSNYDSNSNHFKHTSLITHTNNDNESIPDSDGKTRCKCTSKWRKSWHGLNFNVKLALLFSFINLTAYGYVVFYKRGEYLCFVCCVMFKTVKFASLTHQSFLIYALLVLTYLLAPVE